MHSTCWTRQAHADDRRHWDQSSTTRPRRAYKRRLEELEDDLAEAADLSDEARVARLEHERELLIAELTRAYGLGGRPRTVGDPVERARKAVGMRIATAVRAIAAVHPRPRPPPRPQPGDRPVLQLPAGDRRQVARRPMTNTRHRRTRDCGERTDPGAHGAPPPWRRWKVGSRMWSKSPLDTTANPAAVAEMPS